MSGGGNESSNTLLRGSTIHSITQLPIFSVKSGPRDGEKWYKRLEEEYELLIKFVELNKKNNSDWFRIESTEDGIHWFGICWFIYKHQKYEFKVKFDIPPNYPRVPPEIELPELDGKTLKMYRGGKICMTDHFFPLWAKNVPTFGIIHAISLGLAPWLNTEIPYLVDKGLISNSEN